MVPANVKPGDFGLVHMGGDNGRLIRLGQWLNGSGFSDYEHAFIYIGNGEIVEAEPDGARRTVCRYSGVLWSSGIINPTDNQRAGIVKGASMYAQLHTPYSWADYASLALRRFHIPAPHLKAYVASSGHMICSQLVAKCYSGAGCPLYDRWTGYVTPGDLCQLLQLPDRRLVVNVYIVMIDRDGITDVMAVFSTDVKAQAHADVLSVGNTVPGIRYYVLESEVIE